MLKGPPNPKQHLTRLSLLHPGVDKACISVVVAHRDPEAFIKGSFRGF